METYGPLLMFLVFDNMYSDNMYGGNLLCRSALDEERAATCELSKALSSERVIANHHLEKLEEERRHNTRNMHTKEQTIEVKDRSIITTGGYKDRNNQTIGTADTMFTGIVPQIRYRFSLEKLEISPCVKHSKYDFLGENFHFLC